MSIALEQSLRRLTIVSSQISRHSRRSLGSTPFRTNNNQSSTSDLLRAVNRDFQAERPALRTNAPRFASPTDEARPAGETSTPTGTSQNTGLSNQFAVAGSAIREAARSNEAALRARNLADLERTYTREDLDRQVTRRWKGGDVYAPHDLSAMEMEKWKRQRNRPVPKFDVLDQLGLDPLKHYKNISMLSEFTTQMGRIKKGSESGLRPRNQRKMAKAIRRAVGIGLLPSSYRHPELISRKSYLG